jgi:hypothetical protein
MVWHQHICSDPCTVVRTFFGEANETFVDGLGSKNIAALRGAGGDERNRRPHVNPIKAMKPLLSIFGGHRPPLQFPQSGEKLLMDIVEPAVTENHDYVFWPEHRNDSVHNRVRVLLVKRRPARLRDRRNDSLRF